MFTVAHVFSLLVPKSNGTHSFGMTTTFTKIMRFQKTTLMLMYFIFCSQSLGIQPNKILLLATAVFFFAVILIVMQKCCFTLWRIKKGG